MKSLSEPHKAERDTNNQQNNNMHKMLMKWLGLSGLAETLNVLREENDTLKKQVKDLFDEVQSLEEKVEEIEVPDMDDYVQESDIDDRIDCYLSNNDYCTQSYVDDEIESKVEEAIDDYGIEEKVRDLFNDASPSPMTEDDIKKEVSEAVKITLEKMVKALADQR